MANPAPNDACNDADIRLGFVEDVDPEYPLTPQTFPNKVGGKPVWLIPDCLPTPEQLACPLCKEHMSFLLQIYAPIDGNARAFHRVLYLFCCRGCSTFKLLRAQLPEDNKYYRPAPLPDDEDEDEDEEEDAYELTAAYRLPSLCTLCGCSAPLMCSQCKHVQYCCKTHQHLDWSAGHEEECKELAAGKDKHVVRRRLNAVFLEYELVTEPEPEKPAAPQRSTATPTTVKDDGDDVTTNKDGIDKAFTAFKKRLDRAPEQVLRYARSNDAALWLDQNNHIGIDELGSCPYCGGKRIFEFQVISSLIYYLKEDPITSTFNFGNVLCFTCANSCQGASAYVEELTLRQDFDESQRIHELGDAGADFDDADADA